MNKVVTTREELLHTAQEIVFQDGMDKLSIRALAKKHDISVGAVYNYFPSKSELVLAIIENFWKQVFHQDICEMSSQLPFTEFYEIVYQRLVKHSEAFFSVLLGQLNILKDNDKEKGKQMEQKYMIHIQNGFLYALQQDERIHPSIWNEVFTKEDFVCFLLEMMINDLTHQRMDCRFTKEILERLLYEKQEER
ncbi:MULTISPECIES: TetR/AcrR family transcriptional regulator [Bacillota]|jgi:AcrR family transcriptional regulator|uniref:TetR/AcrR family transcriptional regulator n=3 Tax=Erysipelotrichaceae TaxID=128827 RepID=A0A7G9GQA3_9FIRM|nr:MULTISPECIES: TetR/AcrR family transcriptional regulator [Bacillota]QNM12985.1 TetR/AcrR family transcriptional regulator [[Eubacterium] hominis]MCH4287096.1 TetR/AcrR family transcriptional regulator [Amedibacillus hominis]RGB49181.1 TetR/AcrR family transcriptional regulator [Absiella sp. AM22-9]RGB54900.1 TetR/AcrR family transcriptional regulator [Absiella sp. AM10-20]RGB63924.1 TetR/AcrR family transcriptional regulator [Absiella sp. AM09-45]